MHHRWRNFCVSSWTDCGGKRKRSGCRAVNRAWVPCDIGDAALRAQVAKPANRVLAKLNASACDFVSHGASSAAVLAKLLQGEREPSLRARRHSLSSAMTGPLSSIHFYRRCRAREPRWWPRALRPSGGLSPSRAQAVLAARGPRRGNPLRLRGRGRGLEGRDR